MSFGDRGRALVFDSIEDFHARIDDPELDVDANTVLVLRGCGPKGYSGMPEVSNMPLLKKLLAQGVRDMVRICHGRISGTAYGTVVLHVTPEAAAGGPLALVQTGDEITFDVPGRTLTVEVSYEELLGQCLRNGHRQAVGARLLNHEAGRWRDSRSDTRSLI
jgi:dihydroxyacid dehydratase/phosphogluconate dehydratase